MKNPCVKECPDRSAECKRTCEKWKVYEKKKFEEYEERDKIRGQREDCISYELEHRKKRVRR